MLHSVVHGGQVLLGPLLLKKPQLPARLGSSPPQFRAVGPPSQIMPASALILLAAAPSRTPPTFATEFGLDYTVTNKQYGFVAVGRWTVDHQNSSGSLMPAMPR